MTYDFLNTITSIAVIGLSPNPDRSSFGVASYLKDFYEIIPVNPMIPVWEGFPCYASLTDAYHHQPFQLVNVFRKSEEVSAIVDECIALRIPYLWLQLGVIDETAKQRAEAAGILVIMDECLAVVHRLHVRGA